VRNSIDDVYISGVSCSCLTLSSNSVARAGAGGRERPQLGLPRLRVAPGTLTGIAIGPDHTPLWATLRQNPLKVHDNPNCETTFRYSLLLPATGLALIRFIPAIKHLRTHRFSAISFMPGGLRTPAAEA
jgi:hypothetical protein